MHTLSTKDRVGIVNPPRTLRTTPYVWVSVAVMAWALLIVLHRKWQGDFDLHMATVWALVQDPWSPSDPMVGEESESAYFTPYTLVLALLTRTLGLLPLHAFEVAALVNTALFLWAFYRFCRHFGPNKWLPVAALAAIVLLWGLRSTSWSGFLDLGSVAATLPYPSLMANALMFFAWDTFLSYRADSRPWRVVLLVMISTLAFLIHPFAGVNAALGLLAFLFADLKAWTPTALASLAAGAVVSITLIAAWPYYAFRSLFASAGDGYDLAAVHAPLVDLLTEQWGLGAYGLALVGAPALIMRYRKPLGREMALLLFLAGAVLVLSVTTGAYALTRVIPVALLPLQLSLAVYLTEEFAKRPSLRLLSYTAVALVAAAAGLFGGRYAIADAWPPRSEASATTGWWQESRRQQLAGVDRYINVGDVVMVDTDAAGRALNSLGVYTVEHHMMYPFLTDERDRMTASQSFFSPQTTPRERKVIADRYGVRCVLAEESPWLDAPGAVAGFSSVGRFGEAGTLLCR